LPLGLLRCPLNVISRDGGTASAGFKEADEDFDGGGFAGAVRSQKTKKLTRLDMQIEILDGNQMTIALFEIDCRNHQQSPRARHVSATRFHWLAPLLAQRTGLRRIVLDLQQRQGMQGHAKIDLPRTAVENGANAHDLPLTLLRYPHNLAHRTSGGGDILDHQYSFPRRHREPTTQGHDPSLTLAKDSPHPQGPG